ncbi:MAG: hypothetical protein ACRDRL_07550, partial [Sciscionella sp.]
DDWEWDFGYLLAEKPPGKRMRGRLQSGRQQAFNWMAPGLLRTDLLQHTPPSCLHSGHSKADHGNLWQRGPELFSVVKSFVQFD